MHTLSHVAFVVSSAARSAAVLSGRGYPAGPTEEFPGEGTREIYFGDPALRGRLLLMEPIGDGPYRRALQRRGPGLHHIGLDVENLEAFVDDLGGSGWYLHPRSLVTLRKSGTAWLARPKGPALIEVRQAGAAGAAFISRLEVPAAPALLAALGNDAIASSDELWLTIGRDRFEARDFL